MAGGATPGTSTDDDTIRPSYSDNLIHDKRLDRGSHFAAWEQPELFSSELRAAFRSLR
jgi:hypothetical protein